MLLTASNRRFAGDLEAATGWRRFLIAVHMGVDALRVSPAATARVVISGVAFQVTQCVSVWMVARAIGLDEVTLGVALAFFPMAAILQNLPIGLGGLGVRERHRSSSSSVAVGAPEGSSHHPRACWCTS